MAFLHEVTIISDTRYMTAVVITGEGARAAKMRKHTQGGNEAGKREKRVKFSSVFLTLIRGKTD